MDTIDTSGREAGVASPDAGARRARRYWSEKAKRRLVELSFQPNFSIAETARVYGVNANLLHTWRREYAGAAKSPVALKAAAPMTFASVDIVETPAKATRASGRSGKIAIEMTCGAWVYVGDDVAEETLRRVITVLRARR